MKQTATCALFLILLIVTLPSFCEDGTAVAFGGIEVDRFDLRATAQEIQSAIVRIVDSTASLRAVPPHELRPLLGQAQGQGRQERFLSAARTKGARFYLEASLRKVSEKLHLQMTLFNTHTDELLLQSNLAGDDSRSILQEFEKLLCTIVKKIESIPTNLDPVTDGSARQFIPRRPLVFDPPLNHRLEYQQRLVRVTAAQEEEPIGEEMLSKGWIEFERSTNGLSAHYQQTDFLVWVNGMPLEGPLQEAMADLQLKLDLTKDGSVEDISGYQVLADRLLQDDDIASASPALAQIDAQQLSRVFRTDWNQRFSALVGRQPQEGDRWVSPFRYALPDGAVVTAYQATELVRYPTIEGKRFAALVSRIDTDPQRLFQRTGWTQKELPPLSPIRTTTGERLSVELIGEDRQLVEIETLLVHEDTLSLTIKLYPLKNPSSTPAVQFNISDRVLLAY